MHSVGYFSSDFLIRHETYEKTLNIFEPAPEYTDNINILSRPAHVFRNSPATFEKLRLSALKEEAFIEVKILEKQSDLGLPCYFYAKHKSGEEVFYDGIIFRITFKVTDVEFYLEDAQALTGYPRHPIAMTPFSRSLNRAVPDFSGRQYVFRNFNAASTTNWRSLGINASEEVALRISLNDPNFITVTNLTHVEEGKNYAFYIGSRSTVLELHAHDLYLTFEIDRWKRWLQEKTQRATICTENAYDAFSALATSFWHIRSKFRTWEKSKAGFTYILQELPIIGSYGLLIEAYERIAESRWGCTNGIKQIFLSDEDEYTARSAISKWTPYFYEGEVENNCLTKLSEEPAIPGYVGSIELLKSAISELEKTVTRSFTLNKDLFASAQTEFSVYSLWLALAAILISGVLQALPSLLSPILAERDSNFILSTEEVKRVELESQIMRSSQQETDLTTIRLVEQERYVVRIFSSGSDLLMNVYDKKSQSTLLENAATVAEQTSKGLRYTSLNGQIVVEATEPPVLLIDGKLEQ